MHIQQIEIDNFKSFSGKTVIPFELGFTTISGPNGSGKSNIVDSILFCLGLSTSRTMRAEKLSDLINNTSKRREASVSIMFGNTDEPNEEKIVITRTIKVPKGTGGTSTYYLNGRVSTLTDIHDKLAQHNISPGAYNVLMQGDVTGIINMSDMERRKIIDEIAGVSEFDRKIEKAQKEIESVAGSIERFHILLNELEGRVGQLKEEREQALKYQELKEEKQQYESKLVAAKFLDIQRTLRLTHENTTKAQHQKKTYQQQLEALDTQIAATQTELTQVANEVKRKGEDQQIALKKQIEGLKGTIARKQDAIDFGKEKKIDNAKATERAKEEIQRLETKIDDLNLTMETLAQQQKEVEGQLETEQGNLQKLETQLSKLSDSTGELASTRQDTREQLTQSEDTLAQLNRDKLDTEAEIERLTREKTYEEERSQAVSSQQEQLETQIKALAKQLDTDTLEKEAFDSQIKEYTLEAAKLRVSANEAQGKVEDIHRKYTQAEAQKRAYEEMNLGRSVETVLGAGIDGVHGTLAQLGQADDEFSLALEVALGGRINSIVVDDDGVGQEGIELLKRAKAGRATFLPLSKMRPAKNLSPLPDDDGIVDYAIHLMDFEDTYRDAFFYALSDTVIVETMAVARQYIGKYRMVTLDGAIVEKSGAMSGGSAPNRRTGRLSSGKLDEQLATLHQQLNKADETKEAAIKLLRDTEIKLDSLKEDFTAHMTKLQQAQLEHDALQRELRQLKPADESSASPSAYQEQLDTLANTLKGTEDSIGTTEKEIATLTDKLNAIDAKLPTEEMETIKSNMSDVEFQMKSYEGHLRNIERDVQAKELEKEFHEKGIQNYTDQLEQIEINNSTLEKEAVAFAEEIKLIETQIEGLEKQSGELDQELVKLQEKRDTVQQQLIQEERQKHDQQREISLLEEQIESFKARQHELQDELDIAKQELEEANVDPDSVNPEDLPDAENVLKKIQSLSKKMDNMGAVNMRAIADYDEVMARHEELTGKINTLSHEKEDLGIKINGYSELKMNAFSAAFENVNNNFIDIFARLSEGIGRLILTNPDSPFEGGLTIEAQPRGKKLMRMNAMSGGEKSLTALAFVFAFQRYMPAPFYAFDEVDMFLDGINAERLADMVKHQAEQTQFIVVSLRKPMIENSDRTVGVTQKKTGISKVTGVILRHAS